MKMLHEYFDEYLREKMNKGRVIHKEGDLHKVITAFGKSFEIRYGYYGEEERQNPEIEPYEIYPDFEQNPEYTDDGIPFHGSMARPLQTLQACGWIQKARG